MKIQIKLTVAFAVGCMSAVLIAGGKRSGGDESGGGLSSLSQWSGNGHWYARVPEPMMNQFDASQYASNIGAHLATIQSAEENAYVSSLASPFDWLGGFAPEGEGCDPDAWGWMNGEAWDYENWATLEPSYCFSDGLTFSEGTTSEWSNYYRGAPAPFIMEWSADCNEDGIVDFGQIVSGELEDANSNGIPDICDCLSDVTGDGLVNVDDLLAIIDTWGFCTYCDGDLNGDQMINKLDILIAFYNWGTCE